MAKAKGVSADGGHRMGAIVAAAFVKAVGRDATFEDKEATVASAMSNAVETGLIALRRSIFPHSRPGRHLPP